MLFDFQLEEYRGKDKIKTSIESEWATISFTTLPEKIQSLDWESSTETAITVTWLPYKKIADGSKFLHYKLNFEKVSADSLEYPTVRQRT